MYITAANRDAFNYNFVARSGYIKPVISDACRPILSKTDMNPHGDMRIHPPLPEYKEYGNIWFGDSGKTIMYSSEIMEYPECINYLVQSIVVAKTRKILVVYNRKNKSEELIIKNYLNNRRFGR
ncbi:MAG TPA: hypothetical protein PL053_00380 [Deltaproteobacteria bacterium]|nr:hypothetical protein [Deltaproteobacteria bacterium]